MICKQPFLLGLLAVVLTVGSQARAATETQARAITDQFDQAQRMWISEMKLAANSPSSLAHVKKKKPSAQEPARRLKVLISRDLAKEWTLDFGAWLLENDPALKPESQRALLGAVEKHHTRSPEVGRFCISIIYLNQGGELPRAGQPPIRSRGMSLLRTIKKENTDAKVQGQASLALSVMLSGLGDDHRVLKERITNLREAIIKSAEVKVGDQTVAEIAQDELYKINNLSKGRQAPDIQGVDSSARPMSLQQFRGKVVMLVFWSSWDTNAGKMLEVLRSSSSKHAGKPWVLLGVNRDSLTNLRTLEADALVTWRNFSDPKQKIFNTYRVTSPPYCLVLDQQGVIKYRGNIGAFADAVSNELLSSKKGGVSPLGQ